MLRVDVNAELAYDLIDALSEAASRAPGILNTLIKRRVTRSKSAILAKLHTAPEAVPDLPFIWSYDPAKQARARRWYFANMVPKGSTGGRYQRTGALERAWKIAVRVTPEGGAVEVSNASPGAIYVVGDYQVPSHYLTGWPTVEDATLEAVGVLEDGLIEEWYTAVDPTAGI